MKWDERTIRELRKLWEQEISTAQICRRMGVSKNAIVGKAHRIGLDARPSPIKRSEELSAPARPRARLPTVTLPPLDSIVPLGAAPAANKPPIAEPKVAPPAHQAEAAPPLLSTVFKQRASVCCCWPIGEPRTKTFRFCDETSVPGAPYCIEHGKLAYVKVQRNPKTGAVEHEPTLTNS